MALHSHATSSHCDKTVFGGTAQEYHGKGCKELNFHPYTKEPVTFHKHFVFPEYIVHSELAETEA